MCGRYTLTTPSELIADVFGVDPAIELSPRYNIAPTQSVPVVRAQRTQDRQLDLLRWGLIPSWARDPAIGNRMINARAETAAEKPSFRSAFRNRRCLVVTDGFYEWKRLAGSRAKQPCWIHRTDGAPFAFAGLWESWQPSSDSGDGGARQRTTAVESFTIITTTPNDLMKPIHDRMPVILPAESWDTWLDADNTDTDGLQALLRPSRETGFEARKVGTHVNSPRNDDPGCIAPPAET